MEIPPGVLGLTDYMWYKFVIDLGLDTCLF
jgi:hypothetical protein